MTVTVTMLQTRRGEDGSLWVANSSYSATDGFAAMLVTSNLATATLPQPDRTSLTPAQCTTISNLLANGTLMIFRPTVVPTISSTATPSITMDAGSGNTISGARATINPDTDTIGAQRLLSVTDYTHSISALNRTLVIEGTAAITTLHVAGISSSTTYTGAAYVIGSAETDLSDAIANDARFEFSSGDDVRTVVIVLQQGATARTALCQVTGYSHTGG